MDVVAAANKLVTLRPDPDVQSDEDDMNATERQRRKLSDLIAQSCSIHVLPPVGLGLQKTSLEDKVSAMAHQCFLETANIECLEHTLDTFCSFTTDMGTELGFTTFKTCDVSSLLPPWARQRLMRSDIDEDNPGSGGGNMKSFMENAIKVPGVLHIIHNLSSDLQKCLLHCMCIEIGYIHPNS